MAATAGPSLAGHSIPAREAATRHWDVIVVGAGMGGSAATLAIAEAGLEVLVLDRGQAEVTHSPGVATEITDPDARRAVGRWPEQIRSVVDGRQADFWAPLGCGFGGSTLLYAAALDRFRPGDFTTRSLPDGRVAGWPVDYAQLEPHYARAEAMLEVSGTPDPLTPEMAYDLLPPPDPSPRDGWFLDAFAQAGLNPYRLHAGQRHLPGCDACLAKVCLRDCKRHAGNTFLATALATGRVRICAEARVTRLEAGASQVTGVEIDGPEGPDGSAGPVMLRARAVVLAAGAFFTPVLLINSKSADWPEGLANRHDQVGRNLMFHADRRLAIWARRGLSGQGPKKSIALRDFYELPDGSKCGEMQSTGAEARYGNVLYVLRQQFDRSRLARYGLLRHLLRLPALAADRLLGGAVVFALILEDYPYPENRVVADPDAPSGMRFEYTIPDELRARSKALTRAVNRALKGFRKIWLSLDLELNHGHPCGTCRAGDDPGTSVVDGQGRAHGVDNLWIACGSVLSTSGATNPSLTIAALGLRSGAALAERLGGSAPDRAGPPFG